MSPLPTLETPRLILRPFTPADAEAVFAYARDPDVARYTGWNAHASVEDSKAFIRLQLEAYETGTPPTWAIVLKENGQLIGAAGLVSWLEAQHRAEIGYVIGKPYWGRGYTPEAAQILLDNCFLQGAKRVQAICNVENHASARVLEKIGMQFEGVLRAWAWKNGAPHDVKMYAAIAP